MNAWVFWPHFHGTNGQLQHQPPACSTLGVTNGICLLEHLTLRERFIVKDRFKLPPERQVERFPQPNPEGQTDLTSLLLPAMFECPSGSKPVDRILAP